MSETQAQTTNEDEPEALVFGHDPTSEGEDAFFTVIVSHPATPENRARKIDEDVSVELTISERGKFLASGEAGTRRVTVRAGRDQTHFRVRTVDDNRNEPDGAVIATINPRKGYTTSPDYGTATVVLQDNDVPVVNIAAGAAIAEGETANFSLTANPKPAAPLSVSLTVEDGQFAANGQLGRRSVTIGTDGNGTLRVGTAKDAVDEDDGFITVTINPGADYLVGASASARVGVSDGGAQTPTVTLSAPSAIDEGDTATFTIRANPAPTGAIDITVNLAESGSFAATGEINQRTVTVGTDGVGTFTVATENDRTVEADGTITASIANGSGYLIGAPGSATVTVRDATLRVSISAGPSITEGGTASFTLTAHPRPSQSFDVTVAVNESGSFTDSGEIGSRTVTIGTDGKGALTVATTDDATLEADGTITATVSPGSGYGVGSPARASVSVVDATPRVNIASGGAIIEGDSAIFTLKADPKPSTTIHVDVNVSESGGFLAGGESGTRSVSIDTSGTGTLAVATEDDDVDERQGTITVHVKDGQTPASYGVGSPGSASVRVNDNDGGSLNLAQLSVGDAEVQENARKDGGRNWLEFPVTLDRASDARATFEVRGTTETATTAPATEGEDYEVLHANHLSVTFYSGRTKGTVRVLILDDDKFEEKPETFELVVVEISGAEIADGKAVGTILPDPWDAPRGTPVVTISGSRAVTEGSNAYFTLNVEPAPEEDLVVSLHVYDDPISDFLASSSEGPRTVTVQGVSDRIFAWRGFLRQNVDIETVDDDEREADGSIRVLVESDPDPDANGTYAPGTQDYEASVEVKDNERKVPVITIVGGRPVTEGGDASFTVIADPAPEVDLTVTVTVYDDQASDFVDGAQEGTRTVTIRGVDERAFFERPTTSEILKVSTVDDDIREADGSVRVVVESDPDGEAGGDYLVTEQPYEASVAVNDNERGVPTVTIAGGEAVSEGDPATFTLKADPATEHDLTVTVTVYDDATSDFVAVDDEGTRTVVIPGVGDSDFAKQRHTTLTVSVDTVDDGEREAHGSIRMTVESDPDPDAGGEYFANVRPYEASVNVQDNERSVPVIGIEGGDTVTEGGMATFTLTADPAPESDLTVSLTIYDDDSSDFIADDDEGAREVTIPGVSDTDFAKQRQSIRSFSVETEDDAEHEADGSILAILAADPDAGAGGEYLVDAQSFESEVNIRDNERGVPTVTITGGPAVTEGDAATFTLRADPAPEHDLTVRMHIAETGEFVADGNEGDRTVEIPGVGDSAFAQQRHTIQVFTVETVADTHAETAGEVWAMIQTDTDGNYDAGTHPWEAAVQVRDDTTPTVSVVPPFGSDRSAAEGTSLSFTLNVDPVAAAELRVIVSVAQPGNDYVNDDANRGTGSRTIVIPANASSATVTVDTVDDNIVESAPGAATVTVEEGDGYLVAASPGDTASATIVNDDGVPAVSIHDQTVHEQQGFVLVRMTLSEAPTETVRVNWAVNPDRSTATFGQDYSNRQGYKSFGKGQTEKYFSIVLIDDNAHDPGETIVVELSNSHGAIIADGEAVITIENSDPMPSAWLARFGRAVAESAVDGITARMAAPRVSGTQGTLGGYALGAAGTAWSGDAARNGPATPWTPADGLPPRHGIVGSAPQGHQSASQYASGIGVPAGLSHPDAAFGSVGGQGFGAGPQTIARSMTLGDLLAGSRFAWTGGADARGGSLGFWGQGSRTRFAGAQDGVDLAGDVTTALMGTDYARGDWLVGVALTQSRGNGGYRSLARPGGVAASDAPVGDGAIETSLTAAIPYVSWRASERLDLWGAVGHGGGELNLEPDGGDALKTDIDWNMAATGLRSDLFTSAVGTSLSLVSDALWARTTSDRTSGLGATEGDVTRLRLALEGSRTFTLPGGGSLKPKLELGARHDGGDAETGFGVELGGGIAWSDPRLGLSLDIEGRALISHEDGAMKDRGFSAALIYDPRADSAQGLSLTLRQEFGGAANGGLAALFADDPLARRAGGYGSGHGSDAGRWTMEAGYGLPAFGGRFVGTPHLSYGASGFGRDVGVGWQLAPEAGPGAPQLSFGVLATRRESNKEGADHGIGIEFKARW